MLTRKIVLALLSISLITTVAGAGLLIFNHTIPSRAVFRASVTTNCVGATLVATDNFTLPFTGTSGGGTSWGCGPNSPALTVTGAGSITATYTTLVGYTAIYLIPAPATNSFACETGIPIVSGQARSIALGSYLYCTTFTNPVSDVTFGQIDLQWFQ